MPLITLDLFHKLTRQLLLEFGAFRIEVMVSDWAIRPAHRIALAMNSAVGSLAHLQVIASY